jgi:hypothetical protein
MMTTLTISTIEICIYCFNSILLYDGKKFKPCPLCHGGKIKGEKLKKVNANYQELIEEFDVDDISDGLDD